MNNVKVKLKDIATVKNGSTPSTSNPEYYDGDIIWITPKDLSSQNKRYINRGERTITKEGFDSCSASLVPKGSVLMSSRAPIGLLSIAETELCTNQGFKNFVPDTNKIDSEFLYYYLKIKINDIDKLGSGTTFKEVSKSSIEDFELLIPEKTKDQQKIASVLSALDSKIELNNRINAELEAMAKTLYDYWFVQFDFPDKNGKPYKTNGSKMVWNEDLKREIPECWEVSKVGRLLKTSLGGTPSTAVKEYWDNGSICWLSSGEIANFPIIESELKITEAAIQNSATDLLPKGSVLLSITRHLRPSILGIDACANQSVVGIYEKGDIKSCFLYPYLQNEIPRLMSMRSGAQQPHINKEVVDESLILTPPSSSLILKSYNKEVGGLYDLIINNAFQNQKLIELRDWLLPMLMNGQVKVD
jgi:type I restriction enzyme S subunit